MATNQSARIKRVGILIATSAACDGIAYLNISYSTSAQIVWAFVGCVAAGFAIPECLALLRSNK